MSKKTDPASQEFLDNQYSRRSILRYERIFGHTWVSTGGESTTKEFLMKLDMMPGQRVLDVGCGTGGSAFYMARHYGVHVHGFDLSTNMITIAQDRLNREEESVHNKIKFEVADITNVELPKESYDIIYSRDTILHIPNKEDLYKQFHEWLKPGGTLFITDYCKGDQEHTLEFLEYVKQRGYALRSLKDYGQVIEQAGFMNVEVHDVTQTFITTLSNELKYFKSQQQAFIKDYSEQDYLDMVQVWEAKQVSCATGDQVWGMFKARK